MRNATGVILVLLLAALCFWVAFSSNLQNAVAQLLNKQSSTTVGATASGGGRALGKLVK